MEEKEEDRHPLSTTELLNYWLWEQQYETRLASDWQWQIHHPGKWTHEITTSDYHDSHHSWGITIIRALRVMTLTCYATVHLIVFGCFRLKETIGVRLLGLVGFHSTRVDTIIRTIRASTIYI